MWGFPGHPSVSQQRGKNQPSARFLESPTDDQANPTNGNMNQASANLDASQSIEDGTKDDPGCQQSIRVLRKLVKEAESPAFGANIFSLLDGRIMLLEAHQQFYRARLEFDLHAIERKDTLDILESLDGRIDLQMSIRGNLHSAHIRYKNQRLAILRDLDCRKNLSPEEFKACYSKYANLRNSAVEEARAAMQAAVDHAESITVDNSLRALEEAMRVDFGPEMESIHDLPKVLKHVDVDKVMENVTKALHELEPIGPKLSKI